MKRILITGANSYIGTNFAEYLREYSENYTVDKISLRNDIWRETDFSKYDVVFHVAAIVHKKEKFDMKSMYIEINKNLPLEVAMRAKEAGVKQFIFLSTMAVYGKDGELGKETVITKDTIPAPNTLYGWSKLEAENELNKVNDTALSVVIVRPPMVYGLKCPGNYAKLEKLALLVPLFPNINNKRSMINIKRLCQYVKCYIDRGAAGIFFPQDEEYVNTSYLVKEMAKNNGKKVYLSTAIGIFVGFFFGRVKIIQKIFGNLVYEKSEDF
ncbi:NAD-dependent epimerase/dehydratase family protein [Paenibacillus sp. S150]|uniref:NAD-dependent epimerase/dehydratase family protein n=1 Tax=Paenibacillus sp. S150 TaxID=2749826 RepID=UPI001C56FFB6|nr:NAD-dependent epimerase/dehydratase family protein [Paenibacillus sp. S150]MBW4084526.1 NAD-dependent epimerase/dehydratase family protein [Paenibacillus sp. S150]